MASYLAYISMCPAFPQSMQPHSKQVQPLPYSHPLPPPLCNNISEEKIEKKDGPRATRIGSIVSSYTAVH